MSLWIAVPSAIILFLLFQMGLLAFWTSLHTRKSLFVMGTACLSLLLAGASFWGAVEVTGFAELPLGALGAAFVGNSFFLFLLGAEEISLEQRRRQTEHLRKSEVEKGLDWQEIESWLAQK